MARVTNPRWRGIRLDDPRRYQEPVGASRPPQQADEKGGLSCRSRVRERHLLFLVEDPKKQIPLPPCEIRLETPRNRAHRCGALDLQPGRATRHRSATISANSKGVLHRGPAPALVRETGTRRSVAPKVARRHN